MALKRLKIEGYGVVEPNNVTFTRDGRVEAQVALASTFTKDAPAENGMLLAVDTAKGEVRLPKAASEDCLIGLNYTSEKNYNQFTPGLKNFCLVAEDGVCPRIGFLTNGEDFTTNCICYDTSEFTDETALKNAIKGVKTGSPLYGGACELGAIKISATRPTSGPVLRVTKGYTVPDGSYGVEFQVQ